MDILMIDSVSGSGLNRLRYRKGIESFELQANITRDGSGRRNAISPKWSIRSQWLRTLCANQATKVWTLITKSAMQIIDQLQSTYGTGSSPTSMYKANQAVPYSFFFFFFFSFKWKTGRRETWILPWRQLTLIHGHPRARGTTASIPTGEDSSTCSKHGSLR